MNQTPIPIVILTHSNPEIFCVLDSLYTNTFFPFDLYVVNNNSSDHSLHRRRVSELQTRFDYHVLNCTNRWVLSLNHPVIQKCFDNSPFYVILDDDCLVPPPHLGCCWLKNLYLSMNKYPFIGKLALPLQEIPNKLENFRSYDYVINNRQVLIDNIYECRVDTTLAMYRSNLFMPYSNKFSPKHMSLVRPSLYQGVLCDQHFLTTSLSNTTSYNSSDYITSKCICFALNSAWLSPDNLSKTPFVLRLFYYIVRPISSFIWSLDAAYRAFVYLAIHLLRKY